MLVPRLQYLSSLDCFPLRTQGGDSAYFPVNLKISEEVLPTSPDVAAAAGTLAYSIAYDKSAGDSQDDVSSTSSSKSGSGEYVFPEGLAFSDDEDILQFDADSDTELMKTFPQNTVRMNYNPGGPQPPDLDSLPEEKRSDAWA